MARRLQAYGSVWPLRCWRGGPTSYLVIDGVGGASENEIEFNKRKFLTVATNMDVTWKCLIRRATILIALPLLGVFGSCSKSPSGHIGNISRGAALISWYGCGACHSIPGIAGAEALVGPPLDHFAHRGYVAGMLRNSPDNLIRWIRDPQKIVPGNAMPSLGIDERDARDIAAYLYSIE